MPSRARPHHPRQRFGQHFLHDAGVIRRILEVVQPQPGEPLVEIGPGLGALTRPLLIAVGRLQAVELDRDLIPRLEARCRGLGELELHQADALTFDFAALRRDEHKSRLVGNLPYNIATPLLFHLLTQAESIQDMHFMLQKEVAERLAAGPGQKAYGRLSVMVQYRCQVELLFTIGPNAFSPPPQVESAFVRLLPRAQPPVAVGDERDFARLVRQAFSQRRKTLRNTLAGLLTPAAIQAAGVDPGVRPETLGLAELVALSRQLAIGNGD
ncbi:MAG: 16S rRNA (adenine(1518)-N(6)/adenine(1519)-N(6))-dimethyltransferase RsmA [Candidatus Competibacteraceae bacterium]